MDTAIRFQIHGDDPCDFVIQFCDGKARYASVSETTTYGCSYRLDSSLFLRVIAGDLDLRNAFFAGHVSISGDKELALKFGSLLSMYYRDIDDNVIEEMAV